MAENGLFFPEDGADRPLVDYGYRALRPEDLFNDGVLVDPHDFVMDTNGILYLDSQAKLSRSGRCDMKSGSVSEIPSDDAGFVALLVTTDDDFRTRRLIADIRHVQPGVIYESDGDIAQKPVWLDFEEESVFWQVDAVIQYDSSGRAYFSGDSEVTGAAATFWCGFVDKLVRENDIAQEAAKAASERRVGLRTLVSGLAKVIKNSGRS